LQLKDKTDTIENICKNSFLSLHKKEKKLFIARSQIHGWGAFLNENVKKGELICEYKGEIISSHEAEKRSEVYKKINVNYLFNINDDKIIDAMNMSNKAKFLNDAVYDGTSNCFVNNNCESRNIKVLGDNRIFIFSIKNISSGEELTYEYGKKFHLSPDDEVEA
jgi:histone-lysine N-methyltransferase EZH2